MAVKLSITVARQLGITSAKSCKSPHYADIARERGKAETHMKAWNKLLSAKVR